MTETDTRPIRSKDNRQFMRSEVTRQFSFIDDRFVGERVTVEEAFERVGGFGKFQLYSCAMNTLTNMGAAFFLLAFAFLEKEPSFKCQMTPGSSEWTYGTEEWPLQEEFCASRYKCEIDWANPQSLHNLIEQFDFFCEPKWKIGLVGTSFLLGIVIGCLTVARLGDVYGRKPIYKLGLGMHLGFSIGICFLQTKNLFVLYGLLIVFGMSLTARYYVGYSFNIEMQPKSHQPLVSTIQFLSESVVYCTVCVYFMYLSKNWIYLQIPNIGLSFLGVVFLYTMPESPRFLLSQNRYQAARSVFGTIAQFNGMQRERADSFVFVQAQEVPSEQQSVSPASSDVNNSIDVSTTDESEAPDGSENGYQTRQKINYGEMWSNRHLRQNLIGSVITWAMSSFNFFMLTFFLKYFPGNIFENSLCYAVSDLIAFTLSGVVIKYTRVIIGFRLAFIISLVGGALYLCFQKEVAYIPLFVCLSRVGVTMAFNLGYISVPRLFPIKFQSTVYAVVNFFAHVIACAGPIVAELPSPIPIVVFLAAVGVSVLATVALKELEEATPNAGAETTGKDKA